MEKVLAQLDSIISRIPTPATPTDIITDEQHSIVDRGPTTSTVDDILNVCRDQARKIREISEENIRLRETICQLQAALSFAHEMTASASAERKAARGTAMEIERQLEIALREKRVLEDGLQKAHLYISEAKKKMLAEERKHEQTQTQLNELKERCNALQKEYKHSNYMMTWMKNNKDNEKKKFQRKDALSHPSNYPPGCKTKEQIDEMQLDFNRKLAEKNKEINELVDRSRRQTEIILQQGAEISSLQERIEQLETNDRTPSE
uniref:Uncharacterized protein n=1 Tax=Parascaris univalens TaxID=6257 RepID=A0A914ZR95_PARUN